MVSFDSPDSAKMASRYVVFFVKGDAAQQTTSFFGAVSAISRRGFSGGVRESRLITFGTHFLVAELLTFIFDRIHLFLCPLSLLKNYV